MMIKSEDKLGVMFGCIKVVYIYKPKKEITVCTSQF